MNSNNKETNNKTKTSAIKKSKSKLNTLEQFNLLGETFKIELVPKMICNEKSEMLAKSTSNEKLQATTTSSSPASPDLLTTEASPPSKQLENNSSTVLSLSSLLDLSQNITTQKPEEEDDDDEEYGMNISDDDDDDNDDDDEENFDPQNIAQNFYSQKPYLGL
jgi:hypothetical protein